MRLVAGPELAHEISRGGGLGFIGAGSDISNLSELLKTSEDLQKSSPISDVPSGILPIGIGFLNWGVDLTSLCAVLRENSAKPAAIWFFAPNDEAELSNWTRDVRASTNGKSRIWIQVGTVKSAVVAAKTCTPDVLVIQGADAGGHGLAQSSSIITLLPEVCDALSQEGLDMGIVATGGIMDGRGVAAALMLGAQGVCMGTRFCISDEATISKGYKKAILDAQDGGVNTVRSGVYDTLRGTTQWPKQYNGRGIVNKSYRDWVAGMDEGENKRLYDEALKRGDDGWGSEEGRLTTYAGTGVGLGRSVMPAKEIVEEVLAEVQRVLSRSRL